MSDKKCGLNCKIGNFESLTKKISVCTKQHAMTKMAVQQLQLGDVGSGAAAKNCFETTGSDKRSHKRGHIGPCDRTTKIEAKKKAYERSVN